MFAVLSNDTQGLLYLVAVILAGVSAGVAFSQRAVALAFLAAALAFVALVPCINAFQA